jgi:phosphoribosylglycinamide formyltransferase-1
VKSAVILISGRGSNMAALVEGGTGLSFKAVVSNRPDAKGLEWARSKGIATQVVDHKAFAEREAFDAALGDAIAAHSPDWILYAGFMRIVGEAFVKRFHGKLVNIHPSLLPAFPGLHTHRRALEAGVKIHGATVHFVTAALDNGPILIQAAVPVLSGDTEALLAARVLAQEHRIYPQAARWLAEGKMEFPRDGVVQSGQSGVASDFLISPRTTT